MTLAIDPQSSWLPFVLCGLALLGVAWHLNHQSSLLPQAQEYGRAQLIEMAKVGPPKQARQQQKSGQRQNERHPIPARLRFQVLQRDNFRCQYCGRPQRDGIELHVDHVVPVARGGPTTEDNLMTSCRACNLGKGTMDVV